MTSIASNYDINIAKAHATRKQWNSAEPAYIHYARLEVGSMSETDALTILADTRTRYPAPEFKVDMTYWRCSGTSVGDEEPTKSDIVVRAAEAMGEPIVDIAMTTFDDTDARGVPRLKEAGN